MIDFDTDKTTMNLVGREDRAMLGSNPSARSMAGPTGSTPRAPGPSTLKPGLAPKAINPCLKAEKLKNFTTGAPLGKIFRATLHCIELPGVKTPG